MNKLINTWNRGFNLNNDDFRFIDDAVRTALSDIVNGLSGGVDCILFGCGVDVSGTTATVEAGAIFYNGEIWHVSAHTFTVPDPLPDAPYWVFKTSYDSAGVKTDKDLATHQAYQLRYAEGDADGSGSGVTANVQMPDLPRMENLLFGSSTTNATIIAHTPTTTGTVTLKKIRGIVHISGNLTHTLTTDDGLHLFTCPVSYRPSNKIYGEALAYTSTGANLYKIIYELAINGQFVARIASGQSITEEELTIVIPFQSFIAA